MTLVALCTSAGTAMAATALTGAYAFDAGSGTTAVDASGTGNTGTLSGGAQFTSSGKYAGAVAFDGNSGIVTVPGTASLNATSGLTLEAWVKPTSSESGYEDVIVKTGAGNFPYGLELTNGVPDAYVTTASAQLRVSASSALPLNTWSFVAATYATTGKFRLYVNGTQVAATSTSGNLITSSSPLQMGGDSMYTEFFDGSIDNVRINRAAVSRHSS
jgi:hypothetical protein